MTYRRTPTASCRSCGAKIVWCETASGRRMPVDAHGDPAGNVLVQVWPNGTTPRADAAPPGLAPWDTVRRVDVIRTVSHFATCPNADEHRAARS